jgi:hypothetical protein
VRPVVYGTGGNLADSFSEVPKYYTGGGSSEITDALKGPIVTPRETTVTGNSYLSGCTFIYASFERPVSFPSNVMHVRVTLPADYSVTMSGLVLFVGYTGYPSRYVAGLAARPAYYPVTDTTYLADTTGSDGDMGPQLSYGDTVYVPISADHTITAGIDAVEQTSEAYLAVPTTPGQSIYGLSLFGRAWIDNNNSAHYRTMNTTTISGVLKVEVSQ